VLAWLGGALATALGVALAVPAAAFLTHPTRRRSETHDPVDVGPIDSLKEGVPTRVQVRVAKRRDAWSLERNVVLGGAWLVLRGSKVHAFSTVCPHAGCAVDWDGAAFACPCHESRFEADGRVVSGPSPRPLDGLDVEVKEGRVKVVWRRFRTAVSAKEPV
jgi:Rieske Fe-S protein